MRWQIGAIEVQEALRTIHIFFDVLTADQLNELAHECAPQSFDAGEVLMRQGDPSNSMFCIVEGTVSVSALGPRNHDREIFRLSAGTTVGEMELLTGESRLATVTALTELRLLEISRAEFGKLTPALAGAPRQFRRGARSPAGDPHVESAQCKEKYRCAAARQNPECLPTRNVSCVCRASECAAIT